MRNLLLIVVCLSIALAASGCGGGLSTNGNNPYQGSYTGTYSTNAGINGTIFLAINGNGRMVGTEVNTTQSKAATIQGTISSTGAVSLTDPTGTSTGRFTVNQNNQLVGTLNYQTVANGTITITLTNTQSSVVGGYVGAFTGSFVNSAGQSGNFTMIVDVSGTVTGVIYNTTTGVGNSITGNINSGGYLSIVSTGGGGTYAGTRSYNTSGQLTGVLTNSQGATITVQLTPG
jgi:hypothetical protein